MEKVPQQLAVRYETEAGLFWEAFYRRNSDKFFRDRHYLDKEFPALLQGPLVVLEVGCGVGNSVFPLLDINPQIRVFACDFSPTAVQLVQAHPQYSSSGRVTAFVADITADPLAAHLPGRDVDYCSMVFVLSAVAPDKMPQAVRNVASVLKPGTGRVLFRDYAAGDLAQVRLEDAAGVKLIQDSFYVRGDGTCCYYYSEAGLSGLFAAEGFVTESLLVHERLIENRKSGVKMDRRWIQAVFRYDPEEARQQQQQQQQQQSRQGEQTQPVPAALHQQHRLQELVHLLVATSSSCEQQIAGRAWLLPCSLAAAACKRGRLLAGLLEQLQLELPATRLLIAPPWLQLQCRGVQQQQQQQPTSSQLAAVLSSLQSPAVVCLAGGQQCRRQCSTTATASSDEGNTNTNEMEHECQHWREQQLLPALQQGAAAALVALIAVWQGARRVYACLPSADGGFAAGFTAVVQLNESRVVCERIRPRVWQQGQPRQLQMLQQELLGPAAAFQQQQQQQEVHVIVAAGREEGMTRSSDDGADDISIDHSRHSSMEEQQWLDVQAFIERLVAVSGSSNEPSGSSCTVCCVLV